MARNPSLAPAAGDIGAPVLGSLNVAAAATAGRGVALGANGVLPPSAVAPTPTDQYVLVFDAATLQQKWAQITSAGITAGTVTSANIADGTIVDADVNAAAAIAYSKMNNPGGTTTFLRADGTFTAPSGPVAPTHLPGGAVWTNNSTLVANQAYLIPIPNVTATTTLTRLIFGGSVSSGNMDLGIYSSDDEATFTRLFSTGSFAVPALGAAPAVKTIASQTITPVAGRRWYYGIAADNATANFAVQDQASGRNAILGYFKTTSFALPSSLTSMTAFTTTATVAPVIHGAA